MSVKFAGSRAVDDRRRRRLVSENENLPEAPQKASRSGGYWHIRRLDEESYDRPRSPIASLIPFNPVRIWLICCCLPVLMLALVLICAAWPLPAGHPLHVSFDLQSGHIWRFVTGLMLLACASACWLISWFRAASVNDFEGCFKSWYWSGWAFAIIGVAAGCELHSICSSMVASYARIEIPLLCAVLWLVPVAGIMIEPVRAFTREMWHCRRSWLMLLLCASSAVLYAYAEWMRFQPEYVNFQDVIGTILSATALLTPTLMLSALVSQTHYVMYVSSDPVRKRQSWLISGMLQGYSRLSKTVGTVGKRRRMTLVEAEAAAEEAAAEEARAASEAPAPKSRRKKAVEPKAEEEIVEKKSTSPKRRKTAESDSADTDDGVDDDQPGEERPARRGLMSRLFGARPVVAVDEEDGEAKPSRAELRRQAREAKRAEKAARAAARAEEAAQKAEEAKAARAAKLAEAEESRKAAIAKKEEAKRAAEAKKEEARLAAEAKREEARLAAEAKAEAKKEEARKAAEARKQEEAERAEEARLAAEQKAAERASKKKPRIRVKGATRNEDPDQQDVAEESVPNEPAASKPAGKTVAAKKAVVDDFPQSDDDYDDSDNDGDFQQGSIDMEKYISGDQLDPNSLKGLSKKERRRLRKQHRDQQRAKAG